jgi:hypothetical protein
MLAIIRSLVFGNGFLGFALIKGEVGIIPYGCLVLFQSVVHSYLHIGSIYSFLRLHLHVYVVAAIITLIPQLSTTTVKALGSGAEMLRFLMQEHGLSQPDLSEVGSRGVVFESLNGKRELNVRQIRALAKHFKVSAAVFG